MAVTEDIILAIANLLLCYSLIPQVIHNFKLKVKTVVIQTAAITTVSLLTISVIFLNNGIWFGGGATVFTTILWAVILIQSIIYR